MLHKKRLLLWIALPFLLCSSLRCFAQSNDEAASSISEEQKAAMAQAKKDFADSRWTNAFDEFKVLHEQLPGDARVTEFLAETSLNTGKADYAQDRKSVV